MLDVGCGSGILAIAAGLLGAREVLARGRRPDRGRGHGAPTRRATGSAASIRAREGSAPERRGAVRRRRSATSSRRCWSGWPTACVEDLRPGGTLLASGIFENREAEVAAAFDGRGLTRRARAGPRATGWRSSCAARPDAAPSRGRLTARGAAPRVAAATIRPMPDLSSLLPADPRDAHHARDLPVPAEPPAAVHAAQPARSTRTPRRSTRAGSSAALLWLQAHGTIVIGTGLALTGHRDGHRPRPADAPAAVAARQPRDLRHHRRRRVRRSSGRRCARSSPARRHPDRRRPRARGATAPGGSATSPTGSAGGRPHRVPDVDEALAVVTRRRRPRTAAIVNLGCKVNQSEMEAAARLLREAGVAARRPDRRRGPRPRQHLHRDRDRRREVARRGPPRAPREPRRRDRRDRLLRPGRARRRSRRSTPRRAWSATTDKAAFLAELEALLARRAGDGRRPGVRSGRCRRCPGSRRSRPRRSTASPTTARRSSGPGRSSRSRTAARSSARTASSRGPAAPERSLAPDVVLADVRRALAAGHREIVLTGINIGTYDGGWSERGAPRRAHPDPRSRSPGLVRRILDETAVERIRLSSIEPQHVDDELLARLGRRRAADAAAPPPAAPVGRRRRAPPDGPPLPDRATTRASSSARRAAIPGRRRSTPTSSPASRPRTTRRSRGSLAFIRALGPRRASTSSATRPDPGRRRRGWPARSTSRRRRRARPSCSRSPRRRARGSRARPRDDDPRPARDSGCPTAAGSVTRRITCSSRWTPARGDPDDLENAIVTVRRTAIDRDAPDRVVGRAAPRVDPRRVTLAGDHALPAMTPGGRPCPTDCLFCRIVAGEIPATQAPRGRPRDRDPRHQPAGADPRPRPAASATSRPRPTSTDADGPLLGRLFGGRGDVARREGLDDGWRLVTNVGPDGGQSRRPPAPPPARRPAR